jgi:hypothetical protein
MPRQGWAYRDDVPVMEVTFELPDGSGTVTRVLEIDTGATGSTDFCIAQSDGDSLQVSRSRPVLTQDVGGKVTVRHVVEVIVNMPTLNFRERVWAICYPQSPGDHDGLVRLPFLSAYFDRWGAEKDTAGDWQFYVERAETAR